MALNCSRNKTDLTQQEVQRLVGAAVASPEVNVQVTGEVRKCDVNKVKDGHDPKFLAFEMFKILKESLIIVNTQASNSSERGAEFYSNHREEHAGLYRCTGINSLTDACTVANTLVHEDESIRKKAKAQILEIFNTTVNGLLEALNDDGKNIYVKDRSCKEIITNGWYTDISRVKEGISKGEVELVSKNFPEQTIVRSYDEIIVSKDIPVGFVLIAQEG